MTKVLMSSLCMLLLGVESVKALNFGRSAKAPQPIHSSMSVRLGGAKKAIKRLLARVTVYWACEDKYSRKHKTATGVKLRKGVVAVDPRHIPYGSRVKFPDLECEAYDTGSAVKSRLAARKSGKTLEEKAAIVVDRFFETKREALTWVKEHPLFMSLDIAPPTETF